MSRLKLIAAGTLVALSVAQGALAQDAPTKDTVLATVNGKEITLGHVVALRARLPEQYQSLPDDILFNGIVDQLIQQTVLMNSIAEDDDEKTAIALENEMRAFMAAEVLSRLSAREIPDDELQTAYAARFDAVVPATEWDASHILVATEEEAQELVRLLDDGADFVALAQEKSTGPSGPSGGALGWFGQGQMVAPFEEAVMQMAVGEISPPVQTQFGWHVLRLNDMRNVAIPTLDEVREELLAELRQAAVEVEVDRLVAAADVVRSEIEIDPVVVRDISLFDE